MERRRAMLIDAVTELIIERGTAPTSRDLAEAAGVSEGTIFHVFGDKESLIQAAVERYLDPEAVPALLRGIDPDLPLDTKVHAIVETLHTHLQGAFTLMAVLGRPVRSAPHEALDEYVEVISGLVLPELEGLNFSSEDAALLMRLVAFSSSMRGLNEERQFSIDELARFCLYGLAGRPCS